MTGQQLSIRPQGSPGVAGTTGASGVGAQGLWQPSDIGVLGWSVDPLLASTQKSLGAGIIFLQRIRMATDSTISKVGVALRTAATAGAANAYVGVYSLSGGTATLLGQSTDISTLLNGNSSVTLFSLSAATASQAAGSHLVAAFLVGSATTLPTVFTGPRTGNWFAPSKAYYRTWIYGTAQTALPSTMDLTSATASDSDAAISMALAA